MEKQLNSFNKGKCLFLFMDGKGVYAREASKRGIEVAQFYKNKFSFTMRVIRRIVIKFNLPWIYCLLAPWKKDISNYDVIIINVTSELVPSIVKLIRRKKANMRIIAWYCNPVDKCVDVDRFFGTDCEIWSFDEEDCVKYGLRYNTQYYFNTISLENKRDKFDVFFVGGDKGRIKDLVNIQKQLSDMEITNYFHITRNGKMNEHYKEVYKEHIPYTKVLNYISESKAILDYVSENQSGLTLRPLEALFFKKKLITNDITIVDRDFYRKDNIFVIGKDDIKNLPQFLSTPYKVIEKEVVDKYDFNSWLERFHL